MRRQIIFLSVIVLFVIIIVFILGSLFKVNVTTNITELLNSIIAIVGLLLAFSTVMISYWTRSDVQRQTLYEKQLSVYEEIYYELLTISSDITIRYLSEDISDEGMKAAKQYKKGVWNITRKHWIIYPESIRNIIIELTDEIQKMCNQIIQKNIDKKEQWELIAKHHITMGRFQKTIQLFLGIEILHHATLSILGLSNDYEIELSKKSKKS